MPGEPTKSRVTVLARSTSVSSTPVKPGKTYPLSPLDHAMARHALHLVFYYPPAAAAAAGMGRDRLKESLSEVLTHYPAATGRLTRPAEEGGNWVVRCNDAGVRVLDARVGCSLEEWLRAAPAAAERELAQWEAMGEDHFIWSPFCIQISEFECGGVAIGVSCSHMYADATCATLLVKAWGDVHRRACIVNPPFFHPPGLRARGPDLNLSTTSASFLQSKLSSSSSPAAAAARMTTATFRFPDAAVRRCLADITPACPDATPFDALASLFWWRSCVAAAAGGGGVLSSLTVCIDFRKMMHAPLPHGYFGNSLHFSRVDLGGANVFGLISNQINSNSADTVQISDKFDGAHGRILNQTNSNSTDTVQISDKFGGTDVFDRISNQTNSNLADTVQISDKFGGADVFGPIPNQTNLNSTDTVQILDKFGGADVWAAAAAALRAHMAGLVEEEFWSAVEWVESRRDAATGAFAPAFQMYGPELTCASLDHMFSYGAAFGKDVAAAQGEAGGAGRPAHVAYHVDGVEGEGLILVLPGPPEEGGSTGRTVMVTLPQDQTDRIRRDEVILNLGATLLFAE